MLLSLPKNIFQESVDSAESIADKRNHLFGDAILIKVVDGVAEFVGADMERETRVVVLAHEHGETEDGLASISGKKLKDLIKTSPADCTVKLQTKKGDRNAFVLTFSGSRSRFSLKNIGEAEHYPCIDFENNGSSEIKINSKELSGALDAVLASAAINDTRYFLNGAGLRVKGSTLTVTATDGHRLAQTSLRFERTGKSDGPQEFILPRKAMPDVIKMLKGKDVDISLQFNTNHMVVGINGMTYITKLVDGRFPDTERVIPRSHPTRCVVNRAELLAAMGRVSILANEKFKGVKLTFNTGEIHLDASNAEQDEANEYVECDVAPESEVCIGFNVVYFSNALAMFDTENVCLWLSDMNSSILMTKEVEDPMLAVLMPMRI